MIRLVIADDHAIMREGLKRILEDVHDIEVVGEAVNGQEAIALARQGGFDQILLDLSMPGKNGIDLIRKIRQEAPKLPILVLTMHDEGSCAVRAFRAGAQGFLTKESAGMQLVNAIKKVASGRLYISAEMAEEIALNSMTNESQPHERVTDREFEILALLVAGKTLTEIAAQLHLSVKTVSTHKSNIMEKMGMKTMSELVQYAVAKNLINGFDI